MVFKCNSLHWDIIFQIKRRVLVLSNTRALYASFATSPVSGFYCTWTWYLNASSTLTLGADRFWFHRSLCAVCRSLIRIWSIDVADWYLFETCRRYSYRPELPWFRVVGVWSISASNGKLNHWPAAVTLLIISVPSIGALFQAYWEVFVFWRKTPCVPLSWPAISCVFWESGDTFQHSRLCDSHVQEANRWFPGLRTYIWRFFEPTSGVNNDNCNRA